MVQAPNPSPPMVMGLRILPPSNAALELQQLRRGAFSGKGGWSTVAKHKGFTMVKNLGLVTLVGLTNNNPCLFLFFQGFFKRNRNHRYLTWKCLNMVFLKVVWVLQGKMCTYIFSRTKLDWYNIGTLPVISSVPLTPLIWWPISPWKKLGPWSS